MKKILLLLLISLSFISSANTNSIEGAFGYKLGQVVEGIKLEVDRNDFKDRYENFKPAKPMPPFDTFIVYATLKNKVYAITGYVSGIKMDNYNSCNSNKKFRKLLNALEKKYGEFRNWYPSGNLDEYSYSIKINDRLIELNCRMQTGSYNDVSPNDTISIKLKYRDLKLETLLREENNEFFEYDI